jgi:hypothetical protein
VGVGSLRQAGATWRSWYARNERYKKIMLMLADCPRDGERPHDERTETARRERER